MTRTAQRRPRRSPPPRCRSNARKQPRPPVIPGASPPSDRWHTARREEGRGRPLLAAAAPCSSCVSRDSLWSDASSGRPHAGRRTRRGLRGEGACHARARRRSKDVEKGVRRFRRQLCRALRSKSWPLQPVLSAGLRFGGEPRQDAARTDLDRLPAERLGLQVPSRRGRRCSSRETARSPNGY